MTCLFHLVPKIGLLLVLIVTLAGLANAQLYTVSALDAKGDGRDSSLADIAQLAYHYDKSQDLISFRLCFYGAPSARAFDVNIAIDTGGDDAAKTNWWGQNKAFRFDKLIAAGIRQSTNGWEATIGVAGVQAIKANQLNKLPQNSLQIQVEGDSVVVSVKRTDITDNMKVNVVASVGSGDNWSDDVPNSASVGIDLSKVTPGVREIDVRRNNLALPKEYRVLADDRLPLVEKKGRGKQTLILIPGMYSGKKSFDGFIARNQGRYRFLVLTPPGINGTPSRAIPAAGTSFGELTWTRRLARDLLDLIRKQKLDRPLIVAERQPGAQATIELAIEHPQLVGGVVLVGTNLVQSFFSPRDPTRKTPLAFSDRAGFVDDSWAGKWFKYVTPETWRNGDVPNQILSVDPARAKAAWEEIESTPLEIKVRYLCEFWASDVTRKFGQLKVPVLALVPGFDEKFLADPANSFAKTAFVDSWERIGSTTPLLELVKIPNSRMLVLDDQPEVADAAIAQFIEQKANASRKK
jgi:pimeloyl-ACP methyl ester carboxylesterase